MNSKRSQLFYARPDYELVMSVRPNGTASFLLV